MKLFVQLAAALVVTLTIGQAFADSDCMDSSYRRTSRYRINNEGQQYAVDVMRAIFYVECNSTYEEMARDLSAAQIAANEAYVASSNYSLVSPYVSGKFQTLVHSLNNLQGRLAKHARTAAMQDSAMHLQIQIDRVRGMIGN